MFALNAIILYTTIFKPNHAESVRKNSFCITGSQISALVDGKYEYNDTNSFGSIYYNKQLDRYLYPFTNSSQYSYFIGNNPKYQIAHSFSTIQSDSEYIFIEEDFTSNWHSWILDENDQSKLIEDTTMRLINCNSVCIHSITYEWIAYNISLERSIYYSETNNEYLYRSNINQNNEQWQRFDGINYESLFSQFSSEINMQPCLELEIMEEYKSTINTDDNDNEEILYENESKFPDNLLIIIIGGIGGIGIIITLIILIKKCMHWSRIKTRKHSSSNANANANANANTQLQINNQKCHKLSILTTTNTNGKASELRLELDDVIRRRTMSNGSEYVFSSDDDNINMFDMRKRTISVSGRSMRSNSKFSDILPPSKPPSIGSKPVLTAQQQFSRPLPPTPTSPLSDI